MTESVQVTSEDVKTPTNKPNSKPLKLSNDNAEHGKPPEKADRPFTKVVVRHLPPTMTLESFLEQVSPLPPVDYMYFVKADSSLGLLSFSRAYLNFVNIQDLLIFTEKFDNYVFIDSKGNEYPAIVEYAPFQRIPKQRTNRKKDPRAGTIENDPYYLDFVEALKAEEAQRKAVSKTNKQHFFETTSTNTTAQKVTTTPLLEYLKARKLDKMRVKEDKINEKKKRELERKKAREERSGGRQGEGDAHPIKVVTPPHGRNDRNDRNDRNESGSAHSSSMRHSEDKRPAREVKRREDDRDRARTRDRDRDRDADTRPKDGKRPGKSYQEERQRLTERRQTGKVAPSRAENEAADGGAEAEGASLKTEESRRTEKFVRPTKGLDAKRTPERPKRPERKPVSPREPQQQQQHKEDRKKSYAQEREQRKSTSRKDVPTTSEDARPNPKATASGSADKPAPDRERGDQATSSGKGKDPRAERRIRNKDRPSIEIYRPGMGPFSRQRLERTKSSAVGSSTERDSPSPSPSPSPSVSRAASVTAKPSAHSKSAHESAAQPEDSSSQHANPPEPAKIEDTAKTDVTAAKTEDKAAKTEEIAAKSEDAATKKEEKTEKPQDTSSKSDDLPTAMDAQESAAKTEDKKDAPEGTCTKAGDVAAKTEDSVAKTEDSTSKAEDTPSKGEDEK